MFSISLLHPLVAVLAIVSVGTASPYRPSKPWDAAKSVYEFQEQTWIENIRVRSNGNLILTRFDNIPRLYEIDPKDREPLPKLLAEFPQYGSKLSLSGITEYKPDVFAFLIGPSHYDQTVHALRSLDGTTEIWTINLKDQDPRATKLTSFTSGFANGISHVPGTSYGLISDSSFGKVYRVDFKTGAVEPVVQDPLLSFPPGSPLPIGINGIQVNDEGTIVYYVNSQGHIGSYELDPKTALKKGDVKVLAWRNGTVFDDFAIGKNALYITADPEGQVFRMDLKSNELTSVFGEPAPSHILPGVTAAQFGRTKGNEEKLYLTYNGGLTVLPYDSSFVVPGGLKVLDIATLQV